MDGIDIKWYIYIHEVHGVRKMSVSESMCAEDCVQPSWRSLGVKSWRRYAFASSSKQEVNKEFVACKTIKTYGSKRNMWLKASHMTLLTTCSYQGAWGSWKTFTQLHLQPSTIRQSRPNKVLLLGHNPAVLSVRTQLISSGAYRQAQIFRGVPMLKRRPLHLDQQSWVFP